MDKKGVNIFIKKANKGLELYNTFFIGINNSVKSLIDITASEHNEYFFYETYDISHINDVLKILYGKENIDISNKFDIIELRTHNHLNLVLDKKEKLQIVIEDDIRQIRVIRNSNVIKVKYFENGNIGAITSN